MRCGPWVGGWVGDCRTQGPEGLHEEQPAAAPCAGAELGKEGDCDGGAAQPKAHNSPQQEQPLQEGGTGGQAVESGGRLGSQLDHSGTQQMHQPGLAAPLTGNDGASALASPAAPSSSAEARKPRRLPRVSAKTPSEYTPDIMPMNTTEVSRLSAPGPTPQAQ